MVAWVFIATIAAVGNAGVPMGCFFLSTSLLASMNVPIALMGMILPFYSIIDMVETSLNVWSDVCVATVVHDDDIGSARKVQN
jgi:Na+/H+-dicarboxylate symporter